MGGAKSNLATSFLTCSGRPATTRIFGKSRNNGKLMSKSPIFLRACLVAAIASTIIGAVLYGSRHARQAAVNASAAAAPAAPGQQTAGGNPSAPSADALLQAAAAALESRRSIAAKLVVSGTLFGRQAAGTGLYLEQDPAQSHLLRMELNLQCEDQNSSFVYACDGRYYWLFEELAGQTRLRRVDLERVAHALARSKPGANPMTPEWLNLQGLAHFLRGLRGTMDFAPVESGRLDGRMPVWKLTGQWRPFWLGRLMPEQKNAIEKGRPADLSKLPPQAPDRVILYLSQDDLFPRRMECCRQAGKKDAAGLSDDKPQTLLALEFPQVSLNVPINPARFSYNPGRMQFNDHTELFLEIHGLAGK